MKFVQLSIEEVIKLRRSFNNFSIEQSDAYCIQNFLGGDEFKNPIEDDHKPPAKEDTTIKKGK
eukprot:3290444-Ditylum_brightwellii.AAC.1